jgi:voltage-gated sodium channel
MLALLQKTAASRAFHTLVILAILAAGVLVGVETNEAYAAKHHGILQILDKLILAIFIAELVVKMGACWPRIQDYFRDPWNVFDFIIVAACLMPFDAQYIAVIRLIRLLRVFKLITALPKLQILIGALIKSIPSMYYVGMLLLLLFYVYAVMGVFLFGHNDPNRFGDLGTSFLTLFQVVTLEGWSEIFRNQYYGVNPEDYVILNGAAPIPKASHIAATIYFITFILTGTMIMLNLFIGVIISGMDEAKLETERFGMEQEEDPQAALHNDLRRLITEVEEVRHQLQIMEKKYENQ